ncbi:Chemotaxis response regulator protein-glutamate methylesterase [Thiorhodovibrio winogradskyi]|uniref:Protein-glutamate methylesterase/protein-glutamine glutaminase n=2 Tax=Thiorhodovibrio winogradskyi TaxID=77007 RepID=A0ABZ0S5L1_9GAMM
MSIRVLIVDDSPLARALLRTILEREPDIEVIGEASDGRRAVALALELRPSLVTMDLEMPGLHGLDAIAEIMRTKALPILVVSSVEDAAVACEALSRGALDVITKPDDSDARISAFIAKVRLLAGMVVATRWRALGAQRPAGTPAPEALEVGKPQTSLPPRPASLRLPASQPARLVAIVASTGGPQALASILSALPADFPATVLIAQHIAEGFSAGLAQWLSLGSRLPVQLAKDGEAPRPGQIYLAPSERNLALSAHGRLELRPRAQQDIYHPNCDLLLNSVAETVGRRAIGLILTGMSSDGALGMARIRAQGGLTLAQDEASSVVYGMNRVAIEAGAIDRVVPLAELGAFLDRAVRVGS